MKKQLTPKQQSQRDKALHNAKQMLVRIPGLGPPANRPVAKRPSIQQPKRSRQPNFFPAVGGKGGNPALKEIVTFDEYIQDIGGSIAFTAFKFPVQPAINTTFPKGAIKAALYSEWKMNNCEFYFRPEVSGFAANGSAGKIILAMDYNAANPAPTTKQMVEVMHHTDNMPYESVNLRLDPKSVNRADAKYIRTGPLAADEDIKTYDGGNLWVCTIGQASTALIGELRVRYSFLCTKPTLLNPLQGQVKPNTSVALFQSVFSGEISGTSGTPTQLALQVQTVNNIPGLSINSSGLITIPPGHYLVDCMNGASSSTATLLLCSLSLAFGGSAISGAASVNGSGPQQFSQTNISWYVSTNSGNTLQLTATNTFVTSGGPLVENLGSIRITQL